MRTGMMATANRQMLGPNHYNMRSLGEGSTTPPATTQTAKEPGLLDVLKTSKRAKTEGGVVAVVLVVGGATLGYLIGKPKRKSKGMSGTGKKTVKI